MSDHDRPNNDRPNHYRDDPQQPDDQWTDWYDNDDADFSDFTDDSDDSDDSDLQDFSDTFSDDVTGDLTDGIGGVASGSVVAPVGAPQNKSQNKSQPKSQPKSQSQSKSQPQKKSKSQPQPQKKSKPQSPNRGRVVEESIARPAPRGGGCLVSVIVLGLLAGLLLWSVRWVQTQIDPTGEPGAVIEVAIPRGTSATGLGPILHEQGVIGNPNVWRAWTQMNAVGAFQAGRYTFKKNSSFAEAVAVVKGAPTVPQQQPITIPPGFRVTQVADRVGTLPERSAARFLEIARSGVVRSALLPAESGKNLEGFIAAETLNFDLADDETEILAKLVDEWDRIARDAGLMTAQDAVGYTPYEVLIVASLIEREAKFDDERGKVARVIYNRLKGDTALQLDATTVYDLGGGQPTAADLKKDAPYNTYTRKGLPPTPIATPSVESIKAALAPTEGDWLYYVVTEKDGRSSFANTFQEHRRNIAKGKRNGAL
jgi:UPF0755 protein